MCLRQAGYQLDMSPWKASALVQLLLKPPWRATSCSISNKTTTHLLYEQGLELLVQNLSRLDESNDEDAKGVNTTMGVLENLLEASVTIPPTSTVVCDL